MCHHRAQSPIPAGRTEAWPCLGRFGRAEAIDYVAGFVGERDVVLDAACGTGTFTCGVTRRAGFVAACDYAPKMVEQAARKATRLGLSNVVCGTGDLTALDFADGSFDVAQPLCVAICRKA